MSLKNNLALVRLLVHLGLQSLKAHRSKTLIVGGLMTFGAFLVVVSLALLESVEKGTRQSVVESISGDIQIYDKNAKDKLSLFGGFSLGTEELGHIPSFNKVKDAIAAVDNVRAVVPMGIATAGVKSPGDLDHALEDLRKAVAVDDKIAIRDLSLRVKSIARVLLEQQEKQAAITDTAASSESKAVLERALTDEVWAQMDADPVKTLDWLESKLGPLGEQGNQAFMRLVGTDLPAFEKVFSRTRIVEGTAVPPGARGILVGKSLLDKRLKFSVAMFLDLVNNGLVKGETIAASTVLQETLAKAQRASPRIAYLLPPRDVAAVKEALAKETGKDASVELVDLLLAFFEMDDTNFARRFKLFYEVIGPRIQLYPFNVGDTITLSSFTKSGYLKSMNVKVYGIYTVEGLDESIIAGALSLVDLVTFRELYGQRTAALDEELAAMKKSSGIKDVDRASAEADLFGGADDVGVVSVKVIEEGAASDPVIEKVVRDEQMSFDQSTVGDGLVLSIAVMLKDPSKLRATQAELAKVAEPLGLQVVDWQQATGFIGQITLVVRAVLMTAIFILFLVTIVILNNSMVMATLERVSEFGTLRAIGAQRGFVNAMVVFETGVLGFISGLLGAGMGVAFVSWLHNVGIPAPADLLQVVFGGPRLFPTVSIGNVVAGLIATLIVGVLATLYPARLATRVQPVVAMQGKD
ncbi:MAG: FtsX-like permease family protein [Deltaproteobacteria bacterium]|nr:FtsX-like permease family protein [Deltaproteobacteria bacterium]